MGQPAPPQWWEIIVGIISVPASIVGLVYSIILIQKTRLETQKTRLEILEIENKRRNKKKIPNKKSVSTKTSSDQRSKSVLQKILLDVQDSENRITTSLFKLLSPFTIFQAENSSTNINGQRVVGAIIELILLLLFYYADTSLGFQNFSILFSPFLTTIPPIFQNALIPLVISSVGTTFTLGLMIGDLSGITSFTSWTNLRERKKPFLTIMLATLIVNVFLSSSSAIYQLNLIANSPQYFQSAIAIIGSLAQSLIIVPMLITTAFLFNGFQGFLVILALPLFLLRLPVTVFRKFITKIIYYASDE